MVREFTDQKRSTRREYVKYGGAVVATGLLAGCSSSDGSEPVSRSTSTGTGTTEIETTRTEANGTEATSEDGDYSVSMSPMGTVPFETVPRSGYTGLPNTADMAIAAGQSDVINSIYYPEYHGTLLNHYYDRLEGVSLEWKGLTDSWNMGKEGFYELESDVHLTDPAYASTLENLDRNDVEEIRTQIAPWFGNYYSDRRQKPPQGWAKGYQYYSLWEIFEKVAQVFQAGDRASALAESTRRCVRLSTPTCRQPRIGRQSPLRSREKETRFGRTV